MSSQGAARARSAARARWTARARYIAGALIAILAIVWSADLPVRLGVLVYAEQFIAVMIGLGLCGQFLRSAEGVAPSPLAVVFAFAGLAVGAWIAWRYPVLQGDMLGNLREATVIGVVVIALLVEGCRRGTGWAMPIVFGTFFIYALAGHHLSGWLQTKAVSVPRLVSYLALDTSSLLGSTMIIVSTTVLAFMIFGRVLQACGGGDFFTDISSALFGRYRGGTGKVEVVASALFGSISGSAMANVMSTGIITIPNMKRAGYTAETAAAVEAVSSTGGQIVPPVMGAAAFLMAENLGVRYADVAIAAIVPAVLYFFSVFIQVDYEAARRGIGGIPADRLPRAGRVLRDGWFFLVPFVVVFYLMFSLNMQAEEAVLYAIAATIPFGALIGYGGSKLTARGFFDAVFASGRDAFDLLVICAVAAMTIGLLNITGLALSMGLALVKIGEGNLFLLLIAVAFVCFILGTGLPTTGVYLLVAILAAPSLIQVGVPPMAAHMFVLFHGCLSMISPPIALAAYAAAHIAGADHMRVGWIACRLGWPLFVLPFLFAWSPELLLIGKPLDIAGSIVMAFAGTWLMCSAIDGRLVERLGPAKRMLAGAAAAMMLVPAGGLSGALYAHAAGLALAAALVARELQLRRVAARGNPPVEAS